METPITWTHLQWIVGITMPALLAALTWIGAELAQLRQRREADRQADAKQRDADQAHHDNDLRDLWQALDLHRRESAEAAKEAARFRERMISDLGDMKASLAEMRVHIARPPHQPQPQEH